MNKVYDNDCAPKGLSYNAWMKNIAKQLKTDRAKLLSEKGKIAISDSNSHSMLNWNTKEALQNPNYGPSTVKKSSEV